MNRRALVVSFLAAWGACCGGCDTVVKPSAIKPNGKVTVTIDPAQRPTKAVANVGNEVVIVLPAPNPASYEWQIAQHNAATLKQLTNIVPGGPGGVSTVSFLALRASGTRLLFALVPPTNLPELNSADLLEVQLVVE